MRLVTNKKVVKLRPTKLTVERTLRDAIEQSHTFDAVIVIAIRKNGETVSAFSKMKCITLLWLGEYGMRKIRQHCFGEDA